MPDPLDLAAMRRLASELDAWFTMPRDHVLDLPALATALRAACDEVEKLRGGACRHCGCIKPLEAP